MLLQKSFRNHCFPLFKKFVLPWHRKKKQLTSKAVYPHFKNGLGQEVICKGSGNSQFLKPNTPAGAFFCRRGCGRPRTWPPAAPAWTQRPAGGTRGGCGRRERTDRSRHSHTRAGRAHTDIQNVTPANGSRLLCTLGWAWANYDLEAI